MKSCQNKGKISKTFEKIMKNENTLKQQFHWKCLMGLMLVSRLALVVHRLTTAVFTDNDDVNVPTIVFAVLYACVLERGEISLHLAAVQTMHVSSLHFLAP